MQLKQKRPRRESSIHWKKYFSWITNIVKLEQDELTTCRYKSSRSPNWYAQYIYSDGELRYIVYSLECMYLIYSLGPSRSIYAPIGPWFKLCSCLVDWPKDVVLVTSRSYSEQNIVEKSPSPAHNVRWSSIPSTNLRDSNRAIRNQRAIESETAARTAAKSRDFLSTEVVWLWSLWLGQQVSSQHSLSEFTSDELFPDILKGCLVCSWAWHFPTVNGHHWKNGGQCFACLWFFQVSPACM